MLTVKKKLANNSVYIIKSLQFNEESIKEGIDRFDEYYKDQIILTKSFDENFWEIKSSGQTKTFDFNLSQLLFESEKKGGRDLGTYQDFINALKIYFILELDSTTLDPLHKRFNAFKKVLKYTRFFNSATIPEDAIKGRTRYTQMNLQLLQTCLDFLDFYQIPDTADLLEEYQLTFQEIREQITTNDRNKGLKQRQLAEFQSLFYFDKLIDYFWDFEASNDEKILYYPVYFWWKITSVLPLRPSEFVLTPYDCLNENKNGEILLSVRRSNLKGATKPVSHKIDIDFSIHEYVISNNLAKKIKEYQELTMRFEKSEFLLSKEAYAVTFGSRSYIKNDIFGTINLDLLLMRFYLNIIQDKLGVKLYFKPTNRSKNDEQIFKEEDDFLGSNEIMLINLGDTRHIAMVSLVLNDFNPLLIRDFAGHDDINTSYHYFNHIGKIVKCMSYYKYQELKKKSVQIIEGSDLINKQVNLASVANVLTIKNQTEYKEVEEGRCYSEKFLKGDVSDCISSEYCEGCDFLISDDPKQHKEWINNRRKEIENRLDEEGMFLTKILTSYAGTYNEYEEYQRRMLNIQHGANRYFNLTKKIGDLSGETS